MLASLLLLLSQRKIDTTEQRTRPASRSRIFVVSVYYFLIFVLVVCSPLLLSGRTTGYFAGQSTAVVEILQSSAPGLVMVMMMVGNAAVALNT